MPKKEPTNRLSAAGRAACSAAGRKNVRIAIETRRASVPEAKAAVSRFEAALALEIGANPTAAQQGLILAAVTSFTALFIVREKLRAARRFKRIETLIEQLTPLQGALVRTLRALGLQSSDAAASSGDDELGDLLERYGGRRKHEATDDGETDGARSAASS